MWSAWTDFYGAAVPSGNKTVQLFGPAFEAFAVGLTTGFFVLFETLIICTFGSFRHPNVVNATCLVLLALFAFLMYTRRKGLFRFPIGFNGMLGLIIGMLLGSYGYSSFGYFAMKYGRSRTYPNVDPYQAAATVADGGRLIFAAEARLAVTESAGYISDDGSIYCAAPILGIDLPRSVGFWAVGYDCCEPEGSFSCGDAADQTARGGAVIFGGPAAKGGGPLGWLLQGLLHFGVWTPEQADELEHAKYLPAVRKAEQSLRLAGGKNDHPVFVRWMQAEHVMSLAFDYTMEAWVFILSCSFIYLIVSMPVAWLAGRRSTMLFRHHMEDDFEHVEAKFSPPHWS